MPLNIASITALTPTAAKSAAPAGQTAGASPFDILMQLAGEDTALMADGQAIAAQASADGAFQIPATTATTENTGAPANDGSLDALLQQIVSASLAGTQPQTASGTDTTEGTDAAPATDAATANATVGSQEADATQTAQKPAEGKIAEASLMALQAAIQAATKTTADETGKTAASETPASQDSGNAPAKAQDSKDDTAQTTTSDAPASSTAAATPVPVMAAAVLTQMEPAAVAPDATDGSAAGESVTAQADPVSAAASSVASASGGKSTSNSVFVLPQAKSAPAGKDNSNSETAATVADDSRPATAAGTKASTPSSGADTKATADAAKPATGTAFNTPDPAPAVSNAAAPAPTGDTTSTSAATASASSTTAVPAAAPSTATAVSTPASQQAASVPVEWRLSEQHVSESVTADKLGLAIAAKSVDGVRHFDIRLDPPELGRVQVHLAMDDSGQAQVNLVVDKPQTLELLQRDAANLNRTLSDAGLNLPNNGLNFSLRDQSRQNDGGSVDKGRSRPLSVTAVVQPDATQTLASIASYAPHSVRLDIRV